ncbi:MICOS complex subunit MIC60-like [Clytia hemisphaerica]|uniref:MICOS complex subunit MIC60 n=1 Tax=Clytia hemisphaerica TaxID=252671 RepID=A0A7M6DNR8_9CNID|eukprot:TCONS_00048263-protein
MYRCGIRSSRSLQSNSHARSLLSKNKNGQVLLKHANSTKTSGGSSGLYIGATVTTISGLVGGTAAYAGQNAEFRRSIEDALPFSKPLFDMIHGDIPQKKTLVPVEVDLSIPFVPEVLKEESTVPPMLADDSTNETFSNEVISVDTAPVLNVENEFKGEQEVAATSSEESTMEETEVAVVTEETLVVESKSTIEETFDIPSDAEIEEVNAAQVVSSELPTAPEVVEAKKIEEAPLTEEEIANLAKLVDKEALEVLLSASKGSVELLSDRVDQLHKNAASALRQYLNAFAAVMPVTMSDEGYEEKVQELVQIEHTAQSLVDVAKDSELALLQEIESLKTLVEKVRENDTSQVADDAEKVALERKDSLLVALSAIESVQKDFDFLLKYQEYVKDAPTELQKDLKSFASDMLTLIQDKEMVISELPYNQAILMLALKRQQLYSDVGEQAKGLAEEEVDRLLDEQKDELEKLASQAMKVELKRVEDEKNEERETKVKELEENYEREILSQLKRQAMAHNEHLAEELAGQAKTLDEKHQTEQQAKLDEQKEIYYRELEKKVKSISAIQAKISDIVDVESRQRNAQELWIASQALNGTLGVTTLNGRTRTLMPEMIAILQLGERDTTLAEIVDSFPEQATLFGVVPEKDLINRFKHVKDACKRVAAVQDGDSIVKYFMSYVKSMFVISRWYLTDVDQAVDMDKLTSYEVLAKAEHYIREGDLETATKLMSQLKGVARKLSSDWLNEARLLLETKQTALLLQAYAASLQAGLE